MRVECIRGASIRLCLALILGLLAVSGYVVTPILFAKMDTASEAGHLAGEIFHLMNLGVILMTVAVGSFWLRAKGIARSNWALLGLMLILIAINEYAVSPILADIKAAAGPIDALPVDDPKRSEFAMWHGVSATIHLVATIAAAFLVMLGGHKKTGNGHEALCKKS
ncbi:MAG: DUF4149 domain-containing protein [Mariprofundaceae bacterium]